MTQTSYITRHMSCPRSCGVDVREHNSSDLVAGGCDTGNRARDAAHGEALLENVHIDRLNSGYASLEGPAWGFLAARAQRTMLAMPRDEMAAWFRLRGVTDAGELGRELDEYAGKTEAEMDAMYASLHEGC